MTDSFPLARLTALRAKSFLGVRDAADLSGLSKDGFRRLRQVCDFGPNQYYPRRYRVALARQARAFAPRLAALAADHVLVAGSTIPEVGEWAATQPDLKMETYRSPISAVIRAIELGVLVTLVVNDVTAGRTALTDVAEVAAERFPVARLLLFAATMPPDLATHGWRPLRPGLVDLDLDDARLALTDRLGPVGETPRRKRRKRPGEHQDLCGLARGAS